MKHVNINYDTIWYRERRTNIKNKYIQARIKCKINYLYNNRNEHVHVLFIAYILFSFSAYCLQ